MPFRVNIGRMKQTENGDRDESADEGREKRKKKGSFHVDLCAC